MPRPKPFLRAFFFLFLLACLLTGLVGTVRVPANAAPQLVPSTSIVISQIEALLRNSPVNRSHAGCGKVQDAYALRCAAQVQGAARDAFDFARRTVEIEANAATDNPMVFADTGDMVSGGNFHGAPVAIAADLVSMAVVQLATISERRADRLLTAPQSGLPAFLIEHSGLHSGLMIAQVSAAALASELKSLAHPAGVDTIPTSAGKEDHVSMSMTAGLKAMRSVELATRVIAIEVLCACQGIDLLAPLVTSDALEAVDRLVRTRVPHLSADRPPSPDSQRGLPSLSAFICLRKPLSIPEANFLEASGLLQAARTPRLKSWKVRLKRLSDLDTLGTSCHGS